jgi:hypothetical protein
MSSVVIAGLFGIIGAVIGAAVMWFIQMELRKEKFKEIIYKEKLTVYQQLSEWVNMMVMTVLRNWVDDSPFEGLDAGVKKKELEEKNAKFSDLFGSSLLISASVREKLKDVQVAYIKLAPVVSKHLGAHSLQDPPETIIIFDKKCLDAVNSMRKELHIEAIDDSILGTFKKPQEFRG